MICLASPEAAVAAFVHGMATAATDPDPIRPPRKESSTTPSLPPGPALTGRKVVTSLAEDFMWADHNLDVVKNHLVEVDGRLHWGSRTGPLMGPIMSAEEMFASVVTDRTITLAYAGVDAPGTALIQMVHAASDRGGPNIKIGKPRVLWAIEQNKACQMELRPVWESTSRALDSLVS